MDNRSVNLRACSPTLDGFNPRARWPMIGALAGTGNGTNYRSSGEAGCSHTSTALVAVSLERLPRWRPLWKHHCTELASAVGCGRKGATTSPGDGEQVGAGQASVPKGNVAMSPVSIGSSVTWSSSSLSCVTAIRLREPRPALVAWWDTRIPVTRLSPPARQSWTIRSTRRSHLTDAVGIGAAQH